MGRRRFEFKPFLSYFVVFFKSFKPEYLCSVVLLVKIYIGEKKKRSKRLLKTPGSEEFWKTSVGV